MHDSIEGCTFVYLEKVSQYVAWVKEVREQFARTYGQDWVEEVGSDIHRFPPYVHGALLSWNLELRSMEQVLGLTPEEIAKIDREHGVERYKRKKE